MELSLSAIHDALIADPSLAFVQMKNGDLIPFSEYDKLAFWHELHVYSGSFNPIHDGHKAIYDRMPVRVGYKRAYELSIHRIDKAPLSVTELEQRLSQFVGYADILITNVAKFVAKAGVLPGFAKLVFHVGADTILRTMQLSSVEEIQGFNCSFVYYERLVNGKLLEFPNKMPKNCRKGAVIPEKLMSISSTAIRNAAKVGA